MDLQHLAEKMVPPIAGFFGAVVMLSYLEELSTRQWMSALLAGVLSSYFVPPVALAWLQHSGVTWLPQDFSLAGLMGLILGMLAIHLVAGIAVLGRGFSKDPIGFVLRRGRKP